MNPRPAMMSTMPISNPGLRSGLADSAWLMPSNRVVPSRPKTWLMPYSISADEKAPSRMYLVPPSLAFGLYLSKETRT